MSDIEKKIKRHNTQLLIPDYLKLKELQNRLIGLGLEDITLNQVLTGCIRYVDKKGIIISDTNLFQD
jgi:hypothetical protein